MALTDMVNAARLLTHDEDGDGFTDVFGVGVDPEIIRLAPFVWSNGGTVVDDPERPTRFTLDTAPALVVTQGGPPPDGTTYLPLFVYRNAFEYLRYGYASAATLVMFAVTGVIVLIQWRIVRRWRRAFVV